MPAAGQIYQNIAALKPVKPRSCRKLTRPSVIAAEPIVQSDCPEGHRYCRQRHRGRRWTDACLGFGRCQRRKRGAPGDPSTARRGDLGAEKVWQRRGELSLFLTIKVWGC